MSPLPRHRPVLARWCLALTALLLATGTTPVAADDGGIDRTPPSIPPTSTRSFALAARDAFDPSSFLYSGVSAEFGRSTNAPGYATRYGTLLADGAIGTFMTRAVLPSLVREDARYAALGEGHVPHRVAYALTRTLVSRTRSGATRVNVSEIAGSAAAASLGNLYRAPADRSVAGTLSRFGSQLLWNALGHELKEFWPDIRRKLRKS